MGFRVVDESSFTFKTDLPPSSRNIHPSGVLHAFRTTAPSSTLISTNASGREEHTFAWVNNSIHVEEAIRHLEKFGFDQTQGMVFIPYSTKRNWLDRYPHAAPALETNEFGEVVVYLNWRPYPNGLGDLGGRGELADAIAAAADNGDNNEEDVDEGNTKGAKEKKKRVYKSRALNILQDNTFLPDAERDELHVEIYKYFKWLHGKLFALENKMEEASRAEAAEAVKSMAAQALEGKIKAEDDGGDNKALPAGMKKKPRDITPLKKLTIPGVDVSELGNVMSKMESTFPVVPNAMLEMAEEEEADEENIAGTQPQKGAPFLEEALSKALNQLVAAREAAGKPKRRSRKRPRWRKIGDGPRSHSRVPADWDEMYQRLVQYKEKHGDVTVSKNYKEDPALANWVRGVREKRARLLKQGIEVEAMPEGGLMAKTLTAERIEAMDSLGFLWTVQGPKLTWEERFQELMEYYNTHGKWPSQSMGSIGEWVHKQRTIYMRKDKNYMATKAPKLDEVGFEWTPRGNTRMTWDEGFDLLMEFGRENGHYNVPRPSGDDVDKKGDEHRLYKWVESLHGMYRSYKLGRKSGSLTDERIILLIKHGFEFRAG